MMIPIARFGNDGVDFLWGAWIIAGFLFAGLMIISISILVGKDK